MCVRVCFVFFLAYFLGSSKCHFLDLHILNGIRQEDNLRCICVPAIFKGPNICHCGAAGNSWIFLRNALKKTKKKPRATVHGRALNHHPIGFQRRLLLVDVAAIRHLRRSSAVAGALHHFGQDNRGNSNWNKRQGVDAISWSKSWVQSKNQVHFRPEGNNFFAPPTCTHANQVHYLVLYGTYYTSKTHNGASSEFEN